MVCTNSFVAWILWGFMINLFLETPFVALCKLFWIAQFISQQKGSWIKFFPVHSQKKMVISWKLQFWWRSCNILFSLHTKKKKFKMRTKNTCWNISLINTDQGNTNFVRLHWRIQKIAESPVCVVLLHVLKVELN